MNEQFGKHKWTNWQGVERLTAESSYRNKTKQLDLRLDEGSFS